MILRQNNIKLIQALIYRVKKIKLGNGFDADEMGPVISTEHRNKIESYISKVNKYNCAGGKRPDRDDLKDANSSSEQSLQIVIRQCVLYKKRFSDLSLL